MGYVVRVEVGKGKNRSVMESIILPTPERVMAYCKRNPLIRSNTRVQITNTKTRKQIVTSGDGACMFGFNIQSELKKAKNRLV